MSFLFSSMERTSDLRPQVLAGAAKAPLQVLRAPCVQRLQPCQRPAVCAGVQPLPPRAALCALCNSAVGELSNVSGVDGKSKSALEEQTGGGVNLPPAP